MIATKMALLNQQYIKLIAEKQLNGQEQEPSEDCKGLAFAEMAADLKRATQ